MPAQENHVYYRRRAADERRQAARCDDPAIAAIHLRLAAAYERRLALGSVDYWLAFVAAAPGAATDDASGRSRPAEPRPRVPRATDDA